MPRRPRRRSDFVSDKATPADRKREGNRGEYRQRRTRRAGVHERESEKKVLVPVRIPEGVMGRLMRLLHEGIANKTHSWKTPSEIIRAMIVKGLESMKGEHEIVDEMIPYLEMTRKFDILGQSRREAQASLGRAMHEIRELIGIGAKPEALSYYHVTKIAALKMAPTAWRDWMLDELRKAFPELEKADPGGLNLDTQDAAAPVLKLTKKEREAAEVRRGHVAGASLAKAEKTDRQLWEERMDKDRREILGSREPVERDEEPEPVSRPVGRVKQR